MINMNIRFTFYNFILTFILTINLNTKISIFYDRLPSTLIILSLSINPYNNFISQIIPNSIPKFYEVDQWRR